MKEENGGVVMKELQSQKCIPCRVDMPPLTDVQIEASLPAISHWSLLNEGGIKKLQRIFKFTNFTEALVFTVKAGELAEEQDHHPTILTEWGRVTITYWTHKIKGLHNNDFIMAAKTDKLFEEIK